MQTTQNPFDFLHNLHEEMVINEAYDKELQRLKENRNRYSSFIKEKEIKNSEERKRRNPGE